MIGVIPLPGHEAAVTRRVLAYRTHARCWRREAIPARLHFGTNPRVPPLVCLSDIGWRFAQATIPPFVKGDHGFDNADPSMRAVFLANGPAFAAGKRLAAFDNVDVYPLLRDLIGLPPATGIDGSDAPFRRVMVRSPG
jgi:predicted AlkP superfamily pyrophosphatase or phosphodiesterase